MALLEIRNLSKYFGGLAAVNGVDMDVHDSEILGLIGPNGAGKSTLFNMVNGTDRPSNGKITFKGKEITGLPTHRIASLGIGRTFQATTLFMNETVLENVVTGFHLRYKTEPWKAFLHTPACRQEDETCRLQAGEILDFMGLQALRGEIARNLPHGHQRLLGICLALATSPSLLLLDEPATGMHPEEMNNLVRLIKKLRDGGMTVVVVEHHMQAVMSLCDRLVVLNFGKKIAEGIPEDIRRDKEVIEAYLGSD